MNFVDDVSNPLPAGKIDLGPPSVPAANALTANEYNRLIGAVNDIADYLRGTAALAVVAESLARDALAAIVPDFGNGEWEWTAGNEPIPGTELTFYVVRIQTPADFAPEVAFPSAPQSGQFILLTNEGPGVLTLRADGVEGCETRFLPAGGAAVALQPGDSVLALGEVAGYREVCRSARPGGASELGYRATVEQDAGAVTLPANAAPDFTAELWASADIEFSATPVLPAVEAGRRITLVNVGEYGFLLMDGASGSGVTLVGTAAGVSILPGGMLHLACTPAGTWAEVWRVGCEPYVP